MKKEQILADKLTAFNQKYPFILKFIAFAANTAFRVAGFFLYFSNLLQKPQKLTTIGFTLDQSLTDKYKLYLKEIKRHQDKHGFIMSNHCDSLLFTSLASFGGMRGVDITKACDRDGKWHRRPIDNPCYPEHSKSTISRDMLLGLLYFIYKDKNLTLAEDLWDYGIKNNWIMGDGDVSRIYMTPGLQATLAELIYFLGGKNYRFARNMPQTWPKGLDGYQAHLQALHIGLRMMLVGHTKKMSKVVNDLCYRQGENPLFWLLNYLCNGIGRGSFNSALLNEKLFPSDRLPASKDRKGNWLQERDFGKDWESDFLSNKEHTGGDYLFLVALYNEFLGDEAV
jgi:hypothetical protein